MSVIRRGPLPKYIFDFYSGLWVNSKIMRDIRCITYTGDFNHSSSIPINDYMLDMTTGIVTYRTVSDRWTFSLPHKYPVPITLFQSYIESIIPDLKDQETLKWFISSSLQKTHKPNVDIQIIGPSMSGKSTLKDIIGCTLGPLFRPYHNTMLSNPQNHTRLVVIDNYNSNNHLHPELPFADTELSYPIIIFTESYIANVKYTIKLIPKFVTVKNYPVNKLGTEMLTWLLS